MASGAASKPQPQPMPTSPVNSQPRPPLIPTTLVDGPTQRLWAVSTVSAVQAYKLYFLFGSQEHSASLSFALLIDLALVLVLARLKIPRIDFSDAKWVVVGAGLWMVDWMLMGGWRTMLNLMGMGTLSSWFAAIFSDLFPNQLSLSEHRVRISDLINPSSHLLGQHTIHVLPYSTAAFSPSTSSCQCIGGTRTEINIPIIFNNTEPHVLQYSVTSFEDSSSSELYNVTIPKGGLTTIAADRSDSAAEMQDWDEVEAELIGGSSALPRRDGSARSKDRRRLANKALGSESQQRVYQLPIKHTGRIRLERVVDRSRMDARIAQGEVIIVGCPTTSFVVEESATDPQHKCPGEKAQLSVAVRGLAPLELSYQKQWVPSQPGGKPESQTLSISHISNSRISSPLVGGEGSSTEDALAVALGRRRGSETQKRRSQDFTWAVAQTEVVPIALDLARPGTYSYALLGVKDACGNTADVASPPKRDSRKESATSALKALKSNSDPNSTIVHRKQIEVHQRAHASIVGCSTERPLQLLRGGPPKDLVLKAMRLESDVEWSALLRFQPEEGASAAGWKKNVTFGKNGVAHVQATLPGTYILERLDGTYCSGEIGSPWSCTVVEVPPPTADISFSSVEDVCAGSVGVNAMAILSGQPPFRLQYEIKRSGQPPRKQERLIERSREEFEFRPSTEGAVQYRFTGLSDANYRGITLDGPVFDQVVHPLASAYFVLSGGGGSPPSSSRGGYQQRSPYRDEKLIMRSCEGNRARAEIAFEGTGPFDLTYVVRSGSGKSNTEQRTVKGVTGPKFQLDIDLPPHINTHGGTLTVSLVSIKDGKNCERPLTTADVIIEIRRARPTAAFVVTGGTEGQTVGKTLILEGKEARLPIRLEGEAPWKVEYLREGDSMPVVTTIRQSESDLVVDRPGLFKILSVHDAFCEGTIPAESSRWLVSVAQRPSVKFSDASGVRSSKNDSLLRPAVCLGEPDSVTLELNGQPPLEIRYEHRAPSWSVPADQDRFLETDGTPRHNGVRDRETFTTAQNVTAFQLSTTTPGWHTYELLEVGDTVYPLAGIKGAKGHAPRVQRLEQMVHSPPAAAFAAQDGTSHKKRKSFCVGDTLQSESDVAPLVQLSGQPPFTLEFELQRSSPHGGQSGSRRFVRSDIRAHTYRLDLSAEEEDAFTFDTTGSWAFRILSLEDGNGCMTTNTPSIGGQAFASGTSGQNVVALMEVVDTASIAAVGTREDYCVGETVEYILQGTAPWTVSYAFNGHVSSATVRTPTFSRVAEKAGILEVRSVAHQQNRCKRELSPKEEGMRKVIHPLPSVKVRDGGHFIEDLREGSQTEIIFSLSGTPPFSLTYQRLEAADVYAYPQVLEEHTVAGILEKEMRITASEEGTWRVVWLQDRYCSTSIDGKGRQTGQGRAKLAITEG